MQRVVHLFNWLFLALCGVSLLLSASRGPNPAAFFSAIPFAATLAVLHFRPKKWFVVLALVPNVLVVVALGFFILSALFTHYSIGSSPLVLWLVFTALIAVCSVNAAFLLRRLLAGVAG